MFGLGMGEIIVLGILALVLIGPKQLPEVARTIGRLINDLKRSAEGITEDIKRQAKVDLDLDIVKDIQKPFKLDRDPDLPLKIADVPNIKNPAATDSKPDIVISPPDQMTFTFEPVKPNEVAANETIPLSPDLKNKDGEKKD